MTPKEIVDLLAPMDLERLRAIFLFIARNSNELTTLSGMHLRDGTDWKEFLHELGDALAEKAFLSRQSSHPFKAYDRTCPDCKHEHEDKTECKKYLGEGRFCPCETKVTV